MNKKNIVIIIAALAVGVSGYFGYEAIKNNKEIKEEVISIEEIKDALPDVSLDETVVELKTADFKFKVEEYTEELEFGTPWKVNQSGNKSIAIEGRGPDAIEEGFGFVCLKTGDKVKSLFLDDETLGFSPKYVEWIDDENFLIYMVNSYGRVFTGGTLYMVNVNDMIPKIVYETTENEEISEATKIDADIINMKILEYKDKSKVSVEKNIKIK